ncbi:MAG: glycosyltransferase family 9 protein [Verrucomicrobiota bacterium]|nr:glycosyltransferase family 9 protein [Verrucomicrobiota bacterium]
MRILIVKPSSLGDIIQGLQIAQAIRESIPHASISWVVRDIFAPMVQACPAVHRTYIFERHGGWVQFLKLIRTLREERYDAVLDMQGLFRSALITRLVRANRRLMHPITRECAGWLVPSQLPMPPHPPGPHAVDCLRQFLPALGVENKLSGKLILHSPELKSNVATFMTRHPVVMFPDSRRAEKEWPHFMGLTQRLLEHNPSTSILWSGADRREAPDLDSNPRFYNLTAHTTLAEMIPLVEHARMVVANDSGPMHLAAALEKPLVALFGPTPPERFGPYPLDNPRNRVMIAPRGDIAGLSVDSVFATVREVL